MNEIVCVQDFENYAAGILPKNVLGYCNGGAMSEQTLRLNRTSFGALRIRPRVMRNVANRNLSATILGEKVAMPIGVAPTGMQKALHPDGECATARAAEKKGVVFILSTMSTSSIEEIAARAPNAIKWFQIYVHKNRESAEQMIRHAEKAGFKAVVVTVDLPTIGLRFSERKSKFNLPPHLKLAIFESRTTPTTIQEIGSNITAEISQQIEDSLVWDDIKWLRSLTKLPILVKGVLTAEDALKAADSGAAGVIVSNHGGRQLDGVPSSIEALPEIAKAVGDRISVFLDGGIREGVDVFKALALGARMVFLGRPVLWALACDGENGVAKLFDVLENELDNVLALAGCRNLKDVTQDMVVHKSFYSRI